MALGCANSPTIDEAENYLVIKSELIKLNSYRNTLLSSLSGLTEVAEHLNVEEPEEPTKRVTELSSYLGNNDCLVSPDFGYCYQVTRMRLIQTTKTLERTEYDYYTALLTINQLVDNLNAVIISIVDDPKLTKALNEGQPITDELLNEAIKRSHSNNLINIK